MNNNGWVGVDLDSTLALHPCPDNRFPAIGKPIPKMVERIKEHLRNGDEVRVVTARVSEIGFIEGQTALIEAWCLEHLGQTLEVTCSKDYQMILLYDDRAVSVIPNTGKTLQEELEALRAELAQVKAERDDLQWRMDGLTCCTTCNYAKHTMHVSVFVRWINRLSKNIDNLNDKFANLEIR